jgi:hypothetical protein
MSNGLGLKILPEIKIVVLNEQEWRERGSRGFKEPAALLYTARQLVEFVDAGYAIVWDSGKSVPEGLVQSSREAVRRQDESRKRNANKPPLTENDRKELEQSISEIEREGHELMAERRRLKAEYPGGVFREIGEPHQQRWNAWKSKALKLGETL